ncbi:hypothetical protein LCGC14_1767050 [marine sediment metagenome]|uniref:Uncharacterized protein n=1 Tax=marine sediment metagenome TaxID=412755 RepID=A0A0F9JZ22_9ZZZZ
MDTLNEFEKDICDVLVKYRSYSFDDVTKIYSHLKSFDKTILVMDLACVFNVNYMDLVNIIKGKKEK